MRTAKVIDSMVPEWERGMNPEQLEVIRHEAGPIACYAGAGSGKTRALVHRVVRLVSHVGVAADRIFCVTFSRPGADEMAARVKQLGVGGVEVKTWHAFCARVLREDGTPQGRWSVDDKNRAKTFVKTAGGYQHENWTGMDLTKVCRFIGICKANLWGPEDDETTFQARTIFGPAAQRAVRVYAISQALIEGANLLTFDDMLVYVARHFCENEYARASWAAKFDYVMTDEAQDNNIAQVTLARDLAKDHRNLMVVGDPGQAIYGFRGSSPKFLTDFSDEWSAKVVTMARNYRSGKAIVDVANAIIREGQHRLPDDMTAERGVDGEVTVMSADTLDDEAAEFVSFCQAHRESGGTLADVTVLFRLNAQSRALEEGLLKARIPYVLIGGVNFYERKAVKDLLAYLRLAAGRDKEGDAVRRCINAPFRFLGVKFVERVMAVAESGEASSTRGPEWTQVVSIASAQTGIQERQRVSARQWVEIVENVRGMIDNGIQVSGDGARVPAGAQDVLAYVLRATNYIAWLEKEEGEESIESSHAADVREMQRVAGAFATVGELLDFVELQVASSGKNRKHTRGEPCVTLMSIHKSKGLEWPVVWVVGCNENILPHAKGDPEEERRLMYVAATRARDHLIVSHVRSMATRIGVRSLEGSRFLDHFPGGVSDATAVVEMSDEEIDVEAAMAEREIVAAHPGIDVESDAYVSLLAGEPIVDGMTTKEQASIAAYEGRNPGSVRLKISPTLAAMYGDGVCHECRAPLVTHGEHCGA